ncbi:hypothetical protein [Parendozoicomonas haliclonae]|uniref:Uracil DNA glycosylase superfamily protein n=1 Tax=Parendozoicomonas haliclonae TaxID=1960125 RepID=A0A1X7ADN0_9GAMM|nr:hypothetical protein [Parendozoicomonas haliclonae]SMA32177.1 hypothetical protein EHSB41UT_00116 [Parendozoicomonas haliclonae]
MNERQRQDYLEAMGIQPWFPRFVLPQAKPSVDCDWDFEADPVPSLQPAPVPQAVQAAVSHTPQPPAQTGGQPTWEVAPVSTGGVTPQASSNILSELGFASEEPEAKSSETEKKTASPEATSDIVTAEPFRLAVVDINESCLVVSDLPWSGLNQFTGYHQRLLRNIVRALELPADQEWKEGLFAWPLLTDTAPVDRAYAREAVMAYLNNQFGLKRRKTILLFGRNSCTHLWNHEKDFEQCLGVHERDDTRYGITSSLGELMSIPSMKADAWANLKALRPSAR